MHPTAGGSKTPEREAYEKSPAFKDGQRFRAGIEGRISVLFRDRGMKRCLADDRERFELSVAVAGFANNLMKIGDLLTADRYADEKPPDNIPSSPSLAAEIVSAALHSDHRALRYGRVI